MAVCVSTRRARSAQRELGGELEKGDGFTRSLTCNVAQRLAGMEVRDHEEALEARGIETQKRIHPVPAGRFATDAAEALVGVVRVVQAETFAVAESRLSHQREQLRVILAQIFCPGESRPPS